MAKGKSANICINLVPELTHFELLQYEAGSGSFTHVDAEEFMFDPATREPLDGGEEQLKAILKRLYERNKVPLRSPTTLVIPSFFTRQYTVPEGILSEDLATVLVSEAERFYVFKKIDPDVGYCLIQPNEVLYTAYPKQPLEIIRNAFAQLKIPLVSIDCNYTATLRGLIAMGVVQQEVSNGLKWGLMIASDFNIFMAVLSGSSIEKTLEAPLSLQNIEESSLLNEIRDDFQQFYGYEILNRLILVNNSLKLYSTTLMETLQFQGPSNIFDQNERTLASHGAQDAPFPCSLEAIGGALVSVVPMVPALELADPEVLKTKTSEEQRNLVAFILIAIGILLYGVQFGIASMVDMMVQGEVKNGARLQTEIQQALDSLAVVPEVKRKLYAKQGTMQNYRISNLVIKLAQNLPLDAWLTEVVLESGPDLKTVNLTINGGALSSDPLNNYVKELNTEMDPEKPLSPSITPQQKNEQRYFDYTLTNTPSSSATQSAGLGGQR